MNRLISLALLVVVLAVAAWSLLQPYQVAGHSTYVDLARAEAFHAAVTSGDFTPRWLPDFYYRYGSPIFNFYAPLTYYVIEAFRVVGWDGLWSLKLAYLFFWAAAIFGMFLFAGEVIDRDGAAAAAAAYGVAPYLLVDIYVRAGIAEFACFGWLPWLFWALARTARYQGNAAPLVAALTYAGLVLTHNITAMIVTPIALVFLPFAAPNWRGAGRAASTIGLGVLLSAFFWLPALAEMKHVHALSSLTGGFFQFSNHFLTPAQLFVSKWDFGSSQPGPDDGMGFMFGSLLWLAVLAVPLLIALPRTRKQLDNIPLPLFFAGGALVCLVMTQGFVAWLWRLLPMIDFVQFPWRFLLPASFLAATALATIPALLVERWRPYAAWGLLIVAVLLSLPFFRARYMFHDVEKNAFAFVFEDSADIASHQPNLRRPDLYLTIGNIRRLGVTSTARHDYLPRDCVQPPQAEPQQAVESRDEDVEVLSSRWGYPVVSAEVRAAVQGEVVANQFFFPGWSASVDDVHVPVRTEPVTGRMIVTVTPGHHLVEFRFGATLVRLFATLLSTVGAMGIFLWTLILVRYGSP